MAKLTLTVPDIGGEEDAEVIEICIAVGDQVAVEQSLVVLESDKASMEIPATAMGEVLEILVAEGQAVSEGTPIAVIEAANEAVLETVAEETPPETGLAAASGDNPGTATMPDDTATEVTTGQAQSSEQTVTVPDIGTTDAVEVIEVLVAIGDVVAQGDSLIVLESDKASMEIPAPGAGEVLGLDVAVGAQVVEGDAIARLRVSAPVAAQDVARTATHVTAPGTAGAVGDVAAGSDTDPGQGSTAQPIAKDSLAPTSAVSQSTVAGATSVYAGPAVRKLAREFGVELVQLSGSGPRGRILKEDVQGFVKSALSGKASTGAAALGSAIPAVPAVDFSAFGDIDTQSLSKIGRLTAANMSRSWLNVPHVTQFDDADITELEDFRAGVKAEAESRGVRLTPLPFLLKACAQALRDNAAINASLAADGENIVYKQYVHIGMAVDTPAGLVVPVIRDVDRKSLWQLAEETADLAARARDRKLRPDEMRGGCFTISSLGGIGGTGFTPIVNTPELAILGVSRMAVKPVWSGEEFAPRKMLPLCLSYDHRAVNGGDGGRFMTQLVDLLGDIRRLLL